MKIYGEEKDGKMLDLLNGELLIKKSEIIMIKSIIELLKDL
jgi:hypothetical protein